MLTQAQRLALESGIVARLATELPSRRWFGGKTRSIADVQVADMAILPGEDLAVVLLIEPRYADGTRERYLLLCGPAPASTTSVQGDEEPAWAEVADHPTLASALIRGFSQQRIATERGGALVFGDMPSVASVTVDEASLADSIRAMDMEQSNTSLRLGERHVLKLFRKLDVGESPELEFGRFLTRQTRFGAFPRLGGSVTYRSPEGEGITLAVLQDFVANRGDGWAYVLATLSEVAQRPSGMERLLRDIRHLGAVTGTLHVALASGSADTAFAPEPVTDADVNAWREAFQNRAMSTVRKLEQATAGLPESARVLCTPVLQMAKRLEQVPVPRHRGEGRFDKIRIHGDYHLGQTLKTEDGFVLMDFEGEPARPLFERRKKHCALKDVAGMLRSFDYAIEAAGLRAPQPGIESDPFAERTLAALRARFMDGYLNSTHRHGVEFLPKDDSALQGWIDFFELDKALYEIEYELDHRPDWLSIPLNGVSRILRQRSP